MSSILEIEKAASRLRRDLKLAQLPELKLLCELKFFDSVASHPGARLESYVREFIPWLAIAAGKSDPQEFLPGETVSLEKLIDILKTQPTGVVPPDAIKLFSCLVDKINKSTEDSTQADSTPGNSVRITCLFVEHYPDLDLPPRGRILNLIVTASRISSKAEDDDVVVRNPVSEPDDRFLAQARDSIKAARVYLLNRYGLPLKKRFRFDYAVDSSGARFTGDSLGVAFAIGAIAALARMEVFRDRLSVSPDVVFSGALSSDGTLSPVDGDALKLKIYRAFYSGLKLLVIPREHLADAQVQVLDLEKHHPDRRLDLAGADTIEAVVSDPRLLSAERSSAAAYGARKVWKAKRSVWVEVPALLVLLAVLFYMVAPPRYMPWFDDNPEYVRLTDHGFEALNKDSIRVWDVEYECEGTGARSIWKVGDLDGNGRNNVVVAIRAAASTNCAVATNVLAYDDKGNELWRRYMAKQGEYPGDNTNDRLFSPKGIRIIEKDDSSAFLMTAVTRSNPSTGHIRMFSAAGDSIGWYVNAGATDLSNRLFSNAWDTGFMFGGINNRMECAFLVVLPRQNPCGVSPPYIDSALNLTWVKRGNQLTYMQFPRSDLCRLQGHPYNGASEMIVQSDSVLRVLVWEGEYEYLNSQPVVLEYTVNSDLRVVSVLADDLFRAAREKGVVDGDLPPCDWSVYLDSMRNAVMYWTDSGWVTEGQLRSSDKIP